MKSFFYRSKLLILIFSIAACLLTLASAAIVKFQFSDKKAFEGLSEDYAIGVLKSLEYEDYNAPTLNDLVTYLKNMDRTFIFAKQYSYTAGIGILYSEERFKFPLVSGRAFKEKDFVEHTNTIIVSEDIVSDCTDRNGTLYYMHNNEEYEVIGVFKGQVGDSADETLYYINLAAQRLQDTSFIGTYILDTGLSSISDFEKLGAYVENIDNNINVDFSKGLSKHASKFSNLISNSMQMIAIVFIGGSLVLINSFSATTVWIYARKKEIGIRKMLGATDRQIYLLIVKQYIALIGSSYLLGMLPAFLIVHFSSKLQAIPTVYLLFGEKIDIRIVSLAFFMLLVEGLLILLTILGIYRKRRIIENVR